MATPYDRRRQAARAQLRRPDYDQPPPGVGAYLLAEVGRFVNGLLWIVTIILLTTLVLLAGAQFGLGVNLIEMARDYQRWRLQEQQYNESQGLAPAPTAPARTYPTPAPLGNLPAAQPATEAGLSVSEVNATAEVAAPAAAPAPPPAVDVNSAPATLYQELPGGGTRVGGAWGDAPAEPAPAPQALAPQPQPTAIPENYNPPATSGGRSAGSWGAP
jgi:hypothetical protein